ncbi:HPP family protein [Massilia sp. SM-13]|uniref:HPP family protein n=1 Tax=Pseudoduganella rhizocola TaxID=3382643 RepID=UPI003C77BF47
MDRRPPPRPSLRTAFTACLGIFFGISVLAFSSFDLHVLLALGSFGSTSILLFAFPENHFSQPRSIVGGHFISTAMGLIALLVFGKTWWALGLAVAAAAAVMMLTRTVHPPAGSNPIIVFLGLPGWDFLLFPTLFGAIALVASGWVYHRACKQEYPRYWLGAKDASAGDTAASAMQLPAID